MTIKNKRTKFSILAVSAATLAIFPVVSVVSCNEKSNLKTSSALLNANLSLNNDGENISASDFIDEYTASSDKFLVFRKYTNIETLEANLKLDKIYIESIISVKMGSTYNSVDCVLLFSNGDETQQVPFTIIGFLTSVDKMEKSLHNIVETFQNQIVPNIVAKTNGVMTSEDVWNEWWNKENVFKNSLLFNYIANLPVSILKENHYLGAEIYIKTDFQDQVEAKEWVDWNSDTTDNNIKGTKLKLRMQFSLSSSATSIMRPITVKEDIEIQVDGFSSFQTKFDSFVNSFKSNSGGILIKGSATETTAQNVSIEYNTATTDDDKMSVLNKYFGNIPENGVPLSSGLIPTLTSVKIDLANSQLLDFTYNVSWNGLSATIDINIGPFGTTNSYFNNLIANIRDMQLYASNAGKLLSSEEVVNNWVGNNETIFSNVDGIPQSNDVTKYTVKNVTWNEDDSLSTRGSILYMTINVEYDKFSQDVSMKPITGFLVPYVKYQTQFEEVVNSIKLDVSDEGRKVIVDIIDASNWTRYITGIPTLDEDHAIFNLKFSHTQEQGEQGNLVVSFTYSWTSPAGIFYEQINQTVVGFRTYQMEATNNFANLVPKFNNENYLNSIKKSNTKYADWLTSSFCQGTNQEEIKKALKNIWNLPELFGIDVRADVKYSKTLSSLSNTQLQVTLTITNSYNAENTSTMTWKIDGFMDPFSTQAYDFVKRPENDNLNFKVTTDYSKVPAGFGMGDANAQTLPTNYWLKEPYKFYEKGAKDYDTSYQNKWVNYAYTKTAGLINQTFTNMTVIQSNYKWINKGVLRGKRDYGDVCMTPLSIKVKFQTIAVDKAGNPANGLYNDLESNWVTIYLYWQNCYWNG